MRGIRPEEVPEGKELDLNVFAYIPKGNNPPFRVDGDLKAKVSSGVAIYELTYPRLES